MGQQCWLVLKKRRQTKAYVYVEPVGGWVNMTQTAELVSSLSQDRNSLFGASVAISGRNVVVGATLAPVGSISEEGLSFLFVEPSTGWNGTVPQRTEFMASDGGANWAFGASVSVNGSTAVVGAPGANVNSNRNQGAAYVFAKPSGGWPKIMTETVELTEKDGKAASQLGTSVALSGGVVMSGTVKHSFEGSVDEFLEPATGWQNALQSGEVIASDGVPDNFFGHSIAIDGGVLVVGAYGWAGGSDQGAVYIFGKPHVRQPT
jgi:FG-GAP repeat